MTNDRNMGNIETANQSNLVSAHGIFNNININMFWQRYDSILDKHIEWPLFIKDFVEMLDKKVDVSKLIKYAIELKRQTILLIQNEDNETNYYVQ